MDVVDIYNHALALMGMDLVRATTDPTKNVRILNASYPIARDEVLRAHPWPCLTISTYLDTPTDLEWQPSTAYILGDHCVVSDSGDPDDGTLYQCVTAGTSGLAAFAESTSTAIADGTAYWAYAGPVENNTGYTYQYLVPSRTMRILKVGDRKIYEHMRKWIYTDEDTPVVTLTVASEDPDDWDSYIHNAVALRLATMTGLSLGVDANIIQALKAEYLQVLSQAQAIASGESSEEPEHDTQWIDI